MGIVRNISTQFRINFYLLGLIFVSPTHVVCTNVLRVALFFFFWWAYSAIFVLRKALYELLGSCCLRMIHGPEMNVLARKLACVKTYMIR